MDDMWSGPTHADVCRGGFPERSAVSVSNVLKLGTGLALAVVKPRMG